MQLLQKYHLIAAYKTDGTWIADTAYIFAPDSNYRFGIPVIAEVAGCESAVKTVLKLYRIPDVYAILGP